MKVWLLHQGEWCGSTDEGYIHGIFSTPALAEKARIELAEREATPIYLRGEIIDHEPPDCDPYTVSEFEVDKLLERALRVV